MNLKQLYLTKNACYISGKKHTVKGIMVHSTGANNPNLKRYVGPDDGLLGVNTNGNHWNQNKPDGRSVCVHAFIGKLADGSVATYQTLPFNMVGWHSGSGNKGAAANANNNGYIGFEICEDGLTDAVYFGKVYQEAVELCAYLCKLYSLDPMKDGVLICHSEGCTRGIASNHGDVMHWWPRHGKGMKDFRETVKAAMGGATVSAPSTSALPALTRLLRRTTPMMQGEDIRTAQTALNNKGYDCGTADSLFGDKTLAAVKAFQAAHGLTVDGIVGAVTYAVLGA